MLDESQGIPELAAYTRGPQMPFLGFLCRLKQVSFELGPDSHRADAPPPALLHHPRYLGTRGEPEKNPKTIKENAVGIGDLGLLHSLAGLCLVFMSFQARRGTVSEARPIQFGGWVGGHRRKEHPAPSGGLMAQHSSQ